MTFEFTKENWMPATGDFMYAVKLAIPLTEKPLIQVYFYPEQANGATAILTDVKQVQYVENANIISIISPNPFNGYLVVK